MMMDIAKHNEEFLKIIDKYGLAEERKAEEIAHFLTRKKEISAKEFSELFAMTQEEAAIFVSFIEKGIRFKESHIDSQHSL